MNTIVPIASYTDLFRKTKVHGFIHKNTKKEADLFQLGYFDLNFSLQYYSLFFLQNGLWESDSFSNTSHYRHFSSQFLKCIYVFIACNGRWYLSGEVVSVLLFFKNYVWDMWCVNIYKISILDWGWSWSVTILARKCAVDSLWRYNLSDFHFWTF